MTDNTTLNTGSGGDVIGSDDITGVKYQRIKLIYGPDGTNSGDVATANPLPVKVGDGTNSMPTGDAAARALFVKQTDGTNNGTIKAASTAAAAGDTALVVSLSPNSPVVQATLTKGTQGSTGVSTQDLKDSGRVNLQFHATAVASGTTTTETAITLTKAADTGATSSAASFVITSGKRFRITSITFASLGNATATAQNTVFKLRINTAGAVTTASTPIVLQVRTATAAVASAYDRFYVPIPDGMEFLGNGTIQFGVTAAATFTTNAPTWDVCITGFEY
jgi:hypothetical protein